MNLFTINTGFFKLDGGAMFGVVPKSIWNRLNPADSNNMCTWAMRCLLMEKEGKLMLVDTGIGNKQSEKFFSYYDLSGDDSLEKSLNQLGFKREDITDVFLTHLHFDHCGGAVEWNDDKSAYRTAFKNARYWTNQEHWNHALNSNAREKASFLKENILPIQEMGQLNFTDTDSEWKNMMDAITVSGHTEAMMCPVITKDNKTLVYCADLIPSMYHLPPHYVMSYDIHPLGSMADKQKLLEEAVEKNWILYFEHDPVNECCTVKRNERGGFVPDQVMKLSEVF